MLGAIEFKKRFDAKEVEDVFTERVLPTKLVGRKPSVPQPAPQELLSPSVGLAQSARDGGGFCVPHVSESIADCEDIGRPVSPHPDPLPKGEGVAGAALAFF